MQLNHHNTNFESKTFPITLVCDNVTNAPNIGSLFRIGDAFGVERIIFCGRNIPLGRRMTKTSRATEKTVQHNLSDSILDTVIELKKERYVIISLEITHTSQAIHDFKVPKNEKIALIIGDENFGIQKHILDLSDAVIHINMFGKNSSMNVVQAANIALYEFTKLN